MALVGQEPVLFDTTIRQNIEWGSEREDVTLDEVFSHFRIFFEFLLISNYVCVDYRGSNEGKYTQIYYNLARRLQYASGRQRKPVIWWPKAKNCYCKFSSLG